MCVNIYNFMYSIYLYETRLYIHDLSPNKVSSNQYCKMIQHQAAFGSNSSAVNYCPAFAVETGSCGTPEILPAMRTCSQPSSAAAWESPNPAPSKRKNLHKAYNIQAQSLSALESPNRLKGAKAPDNSPRLVRTGAFNRGVDEPQWPRPPNFENGYVWKWSKPLFAFIY